MCDNGQIAAKLLPWYDRHARALPWRIPPGTNTVPDPYHIWLSEIMLQQTSVVAVKPYFAKFLVTWPRVSDLAAARDEDVMAAWAGLGYYARARNLLKTARRVTSAFDGQFPTNYAELLSLPGVGPYTAAAIAAIVFGQHVTVVDGNIERVMSRLRRVETPLPGARAELRAVADLFTPALRGGDYAQALMDLGATVCMPRNARCDYCPLAENCWSRSSGDVLDFPRKSPKKPKPRLQGIAYIARREDGAVLLEQRPEEGLLGGMLGWPGSRWEPDAPPSPPLPADWRSIEGEITHVFTHFHLTLKIKIADVALGTTPGIGRFVPPRRFNPSDLPTVMRKVWTHALPHLPH